MVDADDYKWLMRWNWNAAKMKQTFYARRTEGGRKVYMHRQILACKNNEGDHRNHDTLDNRRENLRKATPTQNNRNALLKRSNASGFKGVHFHKSTRKWRAQIRAKGRTVHLGLFHSAVEAALSYDVAARKYFGEFAFLNLRKQVRQ